MSWTAVVPIKAWHAAKSRMTVHPDIRQDVARALALDTLDLLTSHADVAQVVLVTSDSEVAAEGRSRGATVLREQASASPLNDAITQGCGWIAAHGDGRTVVVPADLAYLTPDVLHAALEDLAAAGRAHVPDITGAGTTLLAAPTASAIDPHYGPGSSAAHAGAGFRPLVDVDPRIRTDVDELGDLEHGWDLTPRVAALIRRVAV